MYNVINNRKGSLFMKIVVHGFYGAGNAGDDGILFNMIEQIKSNHPSAQIVVTVRSKKIPVYIGKHEIQTVLGNDLEKLYHEVKQCDVVIIGGGGLFQDYAGFNPSGLFKGDKGAINYYAIPFLFAKMLNKKTMFYAIGIGPFKTAEASSTTSWLIDSADKVTVRDHHSLNLLAKYDCKHVTLAADPAVNLDYFDNKPIQYFLPNKQVIPPQKKLIGINLRSWNFSEKAAKHAYSILLKVSHHLILKYNAHILVLPFNKSLKEIQLMEDFKNNLPEGSSTIVYYNSDPVEYKSLCSKLDLMIGMRLHASIFSLGAGVPSIGISYDPKVMELYNEIDLKNLAIPLEKVNTKDILTISDDILNNPDVWKKTVNTHFKQLKQRDLLNAKQLSELINGV